MNIVRKLFGAKEPPKKQTLEEAVANELKDAPPCPVVIAFRSGRYGSRNLLGSVAIPAPLALTWLEDHVANTFVFDFRENVIRKALIHWLADTDPVAPSKLEIPNSWATILMPYLENFIEARVCQIFCPTCQIWTSDLDYLSRDLTPDDVRTLKGHISIRCPKGHSILEDHWEARLNLKP